MRIATSYDALPIPNRNYDWKAWDSDTYCCPECQSPVGLGATEQDAIDDLMEKLRNE